MGILHTISALNAPSEPVRMEPFVAPDLSDKPDRELLETMTLSMLNVQHTIEQILLTAQTNPLMASVLPRP